jgi:hypothetical protein
MTTRSATMLTFGIINRHSFLGLVTITIFHGRHIARVTENDNLEVSRGEGEPLQSITS